MASPLDALDWNDLRVFLRAAQAGSLAGAARALGVDHATIGRRLSALERTIGAPLFVRSASGLELTPLGDELAPLAAAVEHAVHAVRDRIAGERVRVRLAMPSGMMKLFGAGLAELRERHPEIALEVLAGAKPVDLARAEADLAIRSGPVTEPDLVVRRLAMSGFSLYAADVYLRQHAPPADLDDLAGHELIGFDPALAAMPAAAWIEQRATQATIVLRSREVSEMLAAAVAGAGLAMLPCLIGDDEPALRRLTPQVLASRELALVYRREAKLSAAVRAVLDFVVATTAAHAHRIAGTRA
jgi:DNA-binding transcriptional LysR family regulator